MVQCPSCSLGQLPDDTKRCPLCGFQRESAQRNHPHEEGRKGLTPASDPATPERSSAGQGGPAGQPPPGAVGKRADSQALSDKNFAILQREMAGEFRIEPEFQRGKRSLVYRAQEVGSDRPVALKIVVTGGTVDDSVASRFRERAALVQALNHPRIVSLYKFGVTKRFFWYSMEYLEEQSLEGILGGHNRIKKVGGVLGVVEAVADALGYAYLSGVTHGDVKPSNIFVSQETGFCLSDFAMSGLFGPPGSPTAPSALRRPEYMAPEQFSSETVGQEADQYALALVAFRCLVGKPPFTGSSFEELARLHTSTPAPRVDELRPDVPPHVRDTIQRALSKAPEERFADVSDFTRAIARPEEPTPLPTSDLSDFALGIAKPEEPTPVPTKTAEPAPALTKQVDAVTPPAPAPPAAPPPKRQVSTPALTSAKQPSTALTTPKKRTTVAVGAPTSTRAPHPARRRGRTIALTGTGILAVSAIAALVLLPRLSSSLSPPDEPAAAAPAPAAQVAGGTEAIQPDPTPSGPVSTQNQAPPPPSRPTAAQRQPTRTQPTRTQPAPTQPAPRRPAPRQPARTQPAPTQPAPTQPAPTQPAPTQPAPTQPVQAQPAQTPPPAAPPPPPAAAAGSAKLFINATPWGVVYIDGKEMGNTPQINLVVSAGTHVLRVVREGFQPFEREIEVAVDEVLRITDITLVPQGQ